jgi:NADP-dependent 3-hydroxy acid dehydrogenase YdfG
MTDSPWRGRVAVVAGATSDIGRAVALALAGGEARLCLLGRDPDSLEILAKEARGVTDRVAIHGLDFESEESVDRVAKWLWGEIGRADVLVHSTGIFEMAPHADAALADFDRQYRVNVRGPYALTQALLPLLRTTRGQIVFMNSTVGLEARAGVGQYAATHHALRAVADALRAEVNADGVRVLSVYLGRTATARQARIFRLEGRPYAPELLMQPADVADMVLAALRLPRTAEVTEIRMRPMIKSY